ncbi:MAG: hypothetical protein VKQ33_01720 [Candidatus Sericytochromatia bacterium]|nr:hypothetical protein [Candidatus Sericytochromatia bacterium]
MRKLTPPAITPWQRLLVAGTAMLPIAALVPSIGGWVPLWLTTACITVPAWLALFALGARDPVWRRSLAVVVLCGMLACLIYDGVRLTLTALGGLHDGIPNIGRMLVGDLSAPAPEVFALAYYYRYLGDGGGLAMAFFVGQRYGVRAGLAFGASVCLCLWATLALFPLAQVLLFPLTPYALAMTMVGHLVFGGVLGWLLARVFAAGPEAAREARAPGSEAVPALTLTVRETAELPAVGEGKPRAVQGA